MTKDERKAWKRANREAKRTEQGLPIRKEGSLRSEMEHRIRQRAKEENAQLTHCYRDRAIAVCKQFDEWRKIAGWTNIQVREHRSEAVKEWVAFLNRDLKEEEKKLYTKRRKTEAYQSASVHMYCVVTIEQLQSIIIDHSNMTVLLCAVSVFLH